MKSSHTPHINAEPSDFAKTVLMPGDPLRSKFIAENFLTDARLINNVRGVQGYTGLYNGVPVSVMASGMGMPSIGIYSHELFNFFGVENIIRVGSIGAYAPFIKVKDLILGMGACTNSAFANQFNLNGSFAPIASYKLLRVAAQKAEEVGARYYVGNLLSSDTFYSQEKDMATKWASLGVLGVEMEAAALYMNAALAGKNALAICTVSDHVFTGEAMSAEERQTSLKEMITVALMTAASI